MYGVIVLGKEKRVKGPLYPPFYGGKVGPMHTGKIFISL